MRVYVDSCVLLLAAAAAEDEISLRALEELNREDVEYLFSRIVELEIIPQPTLNKRLDQLEFFRTFFDGAVCISCGDAEQVYALDLMCKVNGLALADALHISTAVAGSAKELVTAERREKPLPKAESVVAPMSIRTIRV